MRTLTIPQLEKWYRKKLSNKSKDFRKQAEKSYKIVESALRDVKAVAAELKGAGRDTDPDAEGTVSRFANKIDDIVADFDVKKEITYESMEAMQSEIEFFIKEIYGAGARWIKRMDKKKYGNTIKSLNEHVNDLINEMKKLSKLLYEFSWLKDLERIRGRIETMEEISYGTDAYQEQIRTIRLKINQADKEYQMIKEKYDAFKEESNVSELLNLDDESDHINGILRMKLNTLKKTVKKFNQTDTGVRVTPNGQKALTDYFEDPYAAIVAEADGYPNLIEGLEGLEKALENDSLKIKDRLTRRSIEEIEFIKKGSLREFQEKAKEIEAKRTKYADSDVYVKDKELREQLDEAKKNLEYHSNDLLRVGDDIRREIEKFDDFKERVESEIYEAFDEKIAIEVEELELVPLLKQCKVA